MNFLAAWEELYNPNFKVFESEHFRKQVGLLTFTPSVTEWCEKNNAIAKYQLDVLNNAEKIKLLENGENYGNNIIS